MRLAILGTRGIPARHGGFEIFAEGLAAGLVAEGHRVSVYCEGRRRGRPRTWNGVRLVYVPLPLPGAVLGPLRTLVFDALSLAHASLSHDVCYLLGYGAALFGILPRLLSRALWINMDGLEWRRSKWSRPARAWLRAMEGVALRVADRVVFDAAAVRDDVLARRRAPRRVSVIAYAAQRVQDRMDPAALARFGLRADGYHLVVCRLVPENHVLEIVRAHARSEARLPLVVVCDTPAQQAYGQRCLAAAGADVRWLGPVWDGPALRALREHARSYVHGHSVGGTNPSLLEAMHAGNVCVAHANPFTREVLDDAALYFSNEAELAQALAAAEALSPARRAAFATAVKARVDEQYTWERVLGAYRGLLEPAGRLRPAATPSLPRRAA